MSNSPGLYGDIGKNARDLLYKDYTRPSAVPFNFPSLAWSFDVACKVAGSVPGLNSVFKLTIPDFSKAEVQYLNDFIGFTAGIGMKANPFKGMDPFANISGVLGTTLLSIGADVDLDITTRTVNEFNAGMNFNSGFLIASVTMNDRLDTVRASFYHAFNPLTRTAVAAEFKHKFASDSSNSTTFSFGAQHGLFPFMLLKARVNTDGLAGAVLQQEFWHKFYLAIAGEVDFNCTSFSPKFGFSMSLRP